MNDLRIRDPFGLEPMDEVLRSMLRPWRGEVLPRAPQIRIDVHEDDAGYTVKAELPGVSKDAIEVHIEGNQVTISAELKKEEEEKKEGRVLRSERQYGYASRSFALASEIDEARATAKVLNGVLELTLPRKLKGSVKRLQVD